MRRVLAQARLYGILDLGYVPADELTEMARRMMAGGVGVLQLRAKEHEPAEIEKWVASLLPLTRDAGVPLIINDHPEVAVSCGADGVHVGQDDLSIKEVRQVVGESMLVGKSTHSMAQAQVANAETQVDYIGFGPLFATPTKPDYQPIGMEDVEEVCTDVSLPVFCIGGIKLENLPEVIAAGARRVVIVSGILQAGDVEDYVKRVVKLLG